MKTSIILLGIGAVLCCLFLGTPNTRKFRAAVTAVMFILLALLCAGCGKVDRSAQGPKADVNQGLQVYTDVETGCQYLSIYQTVPTPRMGEDGKQICREVAK